MLRNRVDPHGNIITTAARGAWMGNGGQLHGATKDILRSFKLKAWITCLLEFKDRHREVMSPNLYTELFFIDEATALAAGHRPCFECRRKAYDLFKLCWLKGNPGYGFNMKTSIKKIDDIMHIERINSEGHKVIFTSPVSELPNGTFIQNESGYYLIHKNKYHRWTPFGYEAAIEFPSSENVLVLTSKSTVNAIRAGYLPQIALV